MFGFTNFSRNFGRGRIKHEKISVIISLDFYYFVKKFRVLARRRNFFFRFYYFFKKFRALTRRKS